MRARFQQQPAHGIRDWTVVATAMKLLQYAERLRDWHEVLARLATQRQCVTAIAAKLLRHAERMKRSEPVSELEQVLVIYREQRALQRGEHGELVVRPLDRGQCGA